MMKRGSSRHAQDSSEKPTAAQLCKHPDFYTSSTTIICSNKRKTDGNAFKETDVGILCPHTISRAQGSESVSMEQKTDAELGDVKLSQTESPKAKKRKKSMEVCDLVDCMESDDVNAGQDSAGKRENSAAGGDGSFHHLGKTEKKEKDDNTQDAVGADVRSKKRKGKKKKPSSADEKTADMEVCDPSGTTIESGSVDCLLDPSNIDNVENCDGNAGVGEAATIQSEIIATREHREKTKDDVVLGAEGVSDSGRKSKRKKKKNCESAEHHSNGEGVENFDGEIACDLTSKSEDSATERNCVRNAKNTKKMKKSEKGEADQDDLGTEGVTKVEVKTKKRKKKQDSLDQNSTDNMEEKKDDILQGPEFDREKLTALSSPVLIHRCSCRGQSSRKLAIFDLNGILADIVKGKTGSYVPDSRIFRSVFRRPFLASFLEFCLDRFDVGIWSSRTLGINHITNVVMGDHTKNLLFCFDQDMCITTDFKTLADSRKPLFLKDLTRVWDRFGTCCTCGKRKYDETNTILVDDSPDKAVCNPPYTGIFPYSYRYTHCEDSALGPNGDLRKYLERLADAENIQKFVKENPFGQPAITETHKSWNFYARVLRDHKVNHP